MADLQGKRVLVVGGSSGIGLASAQAALAAGAAVTIAGRSQGRFNDALTSLPGASALTLDITDEDMTRTVLGNAGTFDHVVVSAGGVIPASVRDTSTDRAMAGFAGKFWGAYRVAAFARIAEGGSLTLISGVFAQRPAKGNVAASCVNAAVEALARALALELAPIRVNAISPGLVDTPLYAGMDPAKKQAYFASLAAKLPGGRIGQPDDIGALAISCMTNGFLTGSILVLDGGYSLI